jgi:hypothetical protein
MTDYDIHSCGYYCNRPACIEAQRNELRDKLLAKKWVGLTDEEMKEIWDERGWYVTLFQKIEAKLKEKNT